MHACPPVRRAAHGDAREPGLSRGAAAGDRRIRQRGTACHAVWPGRRRVGRSLAGVSGREIATVASVRDPPARQDLGAARDLARLQQFIADPRGVAPGATPGSSSPRTRPPRSASRASRWAWAR